MPAVRVKKPSPYITKDLGPLIKQFQTLPNTAVQASITATKPISSYSWVEAANRPTILVPSSPPVWNEECPQRVPPDTGIRFSDHNSARMGPKLSPLIPIFASIDHMETDVDLPSFDFITDRNNLLKLLHWATNAGKYEDFRIDVELGGKTCFFTRTDETDMDVIKGSSCYAEEYHKVVTKWPKGSEGATGHHRVISIDLDGVKILFRFEIDARIEIQEDSSDSKNDVDDLVNALSGLLTSSSKVPAKRTSSFAELTIKPSGDRAMIPQSSIIKLKTRVEHRPLNMDDVGPQMYLSQIPYLYLAKHNRGQFQPAQRILPDVEKIELQLGKLRKALLDIVEIVREQGQGEGLCLICVDRKLELYKRKVGTGREVGWEIMSKFVPELPTGGGYGSWADDA
ncbi:hypothetical protein M407DRAFT_78713 [Tulasnella calospora MUT 4182]|uniref:Geranylgeranyl pyrophosphate synthetase n=1 Tax=Tulasnella calospora MUT 4182 TaxID=1051891 RepID=A0A0C3Q2X3_9AGAM|nr:hypothetical protein M407DRAFT_78713 [Tulasnella calospora MUT 4182]